MSYDKLIIDNNIIGPFSDLLLNNMRSSTSKKKKRNNKIMSNSNGTQNINLISNENLIGVKPPKSNKLNMNVIKDSDSDSDDNESIETTVPDEKPKLPERNPQKMPYMNPTEFKYFTNNKKHKPVVEKELSDEDDESEDESDNESISSSASASSKSSISVKKHSKREIEMRKQELLVKLLALEKKGVTLTKSYSLKSSLEEIEFEYNTQQKAAEIQASVHFQEKILMAAVTGMEFLNKKFDPIGAKLDGWSESVMDNITDYEEIFKELHEKYQQKSTMPPELRLLVTLAGSGFMFHLTNSLFKSTMPGIGDVLNSNPDIMKNIMGAMGKAMNQQVQNPSPPMPPMPQMPPMPPMPPASPPNLPTSVPQMPFAFPPQMPQSQSLNQDSSQKPKQEISGPSLNLSSLMNNFNNVPAKPILQQAPKYDTEDEDRFSEASSSNDSSSKMISVTNIPKRKNQKSKIPAGRTIKIS